MTTENNKHSKVAFNLQEYLSSKTGDEWLSKVKVQDGNDKYFRYYAPPVAWEDIDRHDQSSSGDFIFDVTMRIKNDDDNSNQQVCFQSCNIWLYLDVDKMYTEHSICIKTTKYDRSNIITINKRN